MSKKLFDFCIGNPPYNDDFNNSGDNGTYAKPIYNNFMDATYSVSDKTELITPARFLFNAGSTPKAWNKKMLLDKHFKVIRYEEDPRKLFENTDIKGGVAITYYDNDADFGKIEVFTQNKNLNTLLKKVTAKTEESLEKIAVTGYAYHFTPALYEDHPEFIGLMSKGHEFDLKSNVFDTMPGAFLKKKPDENDNYIRIFGRKNNRRIAVYIKRKYINNVVNLDSYKFFISRGSGRGTYGEPLIMPFIGYPGDGATETFMSIGHFTTEEETKNAIKYIQTKFARSLIGILKVTQIITPGVFKYVPLQDFSDHSDIDWSQSIHDIDRQLYRKYDLSDDEINFIETHVKEMD